MYAPTAGRGGVRAFGAREGEDHEQQPGGGDDLGEQVRRRGAVMCGNADRGEGEHAIGRDGAEHAAGYTRDSSRPYASSISHRPRTKASRSRPH